MSSAGAAWQGRSSDRRRIDGRVSVTAVTECDGFRELVAGVDLHSLRTGIGTGPTLVSRAAGKGYAATAVRAGFPTFSRAVLDRGAVMAAVVSVAPPGSRWCEHEVRAGDVLIYGPGARHTAVDPAGVRFAFAVLDERALRRAAEVMGVEPDWPTAGEVRVLPRDLTHALRYVLPALLNPRVRSSRRATGHDLMWATVTALCAGSPHTLTAGRRIDNGSVVAACLDHAESVRRVPSVGELCEAAFVCRRKLWDAFDATTGMSPGRFFRAWGLAAARRRLLAGSVATTTVQQVAIDLGFSHAGRFASRYTRMFGESPSMTLRA